MKILVTGAAGFIGSNLVAELLRRGHAVVGIDNLSQSSRLNLAEVADQPLFDFREADIRDESAMLDAADGCDVIVHLAALKIPRYSDALDTLMVNGLGSEIVAQTARANRAKLVIASTSDVYGKNPEVPFSEDSDSVIGNPQVKRWSYAISKMFEEQLVFAYHERHGIQVVVLRLFGGYGPNQNLTWWGGPQSVFINCALDDEASGCTATGARPAPSPTSGPRRRVRRRGRARRGGQPGRQPRRQRRDQHRGARRAVWRLVRGEGSPCRSRRSRTSPSAATRTSSAACRT